MESIFDSLITYERSLTTFGNSQLARLDYDSIDPFNSILLNKIIIALTSNSLKYETSTMERLQMWLNLVGEIKQDNDKFLYFLGCLSNKAIYSLISDGQTQPEYDNYLNLLVSKSILNLNITSTIPNFFMYYAILPYDIVKMRYWIHLVQTQQPSITILTQALHQDTLRFDVFLDDFKDNVTVIMTCFLQIVAALMSLYANDDDRIRFNDLTVNDILITKSDIENVNYGEIGSIKTHGYVAMVANYSKVTGGVTIGNKVHQLPGSPRKEDDNPIKSFVNSIVAHYNNPYSFGDEMRSFYPGLKKIWGRMMYTVIKDSFIVIEEELGDLPIFKSVLSKGSVVPLYVFSEDVPTINPVEVTKWGPWADIRMAYSFVDNSKENSFIGIVNAAKIAINMQQKRYYMELINFGRLVRKNKEKYIGNDVAAQALNSLSKFVSLEKIMSYLFSSEESYAIQALRIMIKNNWRSLKKRINPKQRKYISLQLLESSS